MAGTNCGKLDLTKVSQDELITINDATWVKADVDEKIYTVNGLPNVVIKFSEMCAATVCDDQNSLRPPLAGYFNATQAKKGSESPPSSSGSQDKAESLQTSINNETQEINQSQSSVDANAVDIFSWQAAAVKPAAAIIPMKSNIKTYGPYASSNFGNSAGGTQVEINTDLAPWVFGSIGAMNSVGQSIVESMAIGLVKSETGSITIPGLPLSMFTNLGMALNSSGPTLSSIGFSFGSSGITTTYEFKTYTPKFGGLNRHMVDKMKSIAKNRTEQLRFLRNNQITQNKIGRKLRNVRNTQRPAQAPRGTLNRVLVGEIYDYEKTTEYSQCTIVGMDKLRNSVNEMSYNYEKKAYMSLDGLYGPVSLKGDGGLPRYAGFKNPSPLLPGHQSSPISPQPPFSKNGDCSQSPVEHEQYNLDITQDFLNPLTNKFDTDEHHHTGPGDGHVIDLVGRGNEVPKEGLITNFYKPDDEKRYSEDYRFLGMRGPIVLHSWGYDLDGKPIPNESDTDDNTKQGIFKKENLKDKFLKDWLKKPATWPAAPIDLRFDRERGLWVSPQPYRIVVAKIVVRVPAYGAGKGIIIPSNKNQLYDDNGNLINPDSSISCECVDSSGNPSNSGTNPPLPKKTEIEVIVDIALTNAGLVAKRKKITVLNATDISELIISTTSCPTGTGGGGGGPEPPCEPTYPANCDDGCGGINDTIWWYDEDKNECVTCTSTSDKIPTLDIYSTKDVCEQQNVKNCYDLDPINNLNKWFKLPGESVCNKCADEGDGYPKVPKDTEFFDTLELCEAVNGPCTSNEGVFEGAIKIVDRIGVSHEVGERVYVYYDTLEEEYIVLTY